MSEQIADLAEMEIREFLADFMEGGSVAPGKLQRAADHVVTLKEALASAEAEKAALKARIQTQDHVINDRTEGAMLLAVERDRLRRENETMKAALEDYAAAEVFYPLITMKRLAREALAAVGSERGGG